MNFIFLLFLYYELEKRKTTRVRLCTWNINGVVQNSKSLQERLKQIHSWWPFDFTINVLALQEVFKKSGEKFNNVEFVKDLVSSSFGLPNHYFIEDTGLTFETPGLMTCFESGKQVKTYFEPFQKRRSYDKYANKGFMDCFLVSENIHIINLHMQSIMYQKDWTFLSFTQRSQIEQILMYVRNFEKVILCGDFNIRDDSWIGMYLQSRLIAFGFKKIVTRKNTNYENEYLDQVWVKGCKKFKSLDLCGMESLVSSDHIPLFVEIEF
jgi:endonuclease/exonuclease/phosphatase family metal-dependent hydrolase